MKDEIKVDTRLIGFGVVLILLGLVAPKILNVDNCGIVRLLEQSIDNRSTGSLLYASVRLVTLNTVRALPIYSGVFIIAEGFGVLSNSNWIKFFILLVIPFMYQAVGKVYDISYDFGVPAIALILAILLFNRMKNMGRKVIHKEVVFALLLFGVQWLDIIPLLSNYGMGRGDISMDIKRIAQFNDIEGILNLIGLSMFITFVTNSFIIARLLNIYTREIKSVEHALELEQVTRELQLKSVENRSLHEMQALVHDLKTPLTTIQGLAGVISIADDTAAAKEYGQYISQTVDKMNIMISELLNDSNKHVIRVDELIEYSVAHIPKLNDLHKFEFTIAENDLYIYVNKIKMARAIINILANAIEAVDITNGIIKVCIFRKNKNIQIEVVDNGKGIAEQDFEKVWEIGFSSKNSSGIGLTFVHDVVTKNDGRVSIESNGQGTKVTISLPEVQI